MTREEILAMSAGRKLDALVAKYVMFPRHSHPVDEIQGWCQCYSTLISAAWEVVEKLKRNEKRCFIQTGIMWCCEIEGKTVFCETAPEAICKAALLAVMEGKDKAYG